MTELKDTPQHPKFKILLIGDNCTDVYQYGTVDRLSPEAPVPVFVPFRSETKEGMAGNVASNLEALGCGVTFIGGQVSKKTRLIDLRSKQHVARIDEDVVSEEINLKNADLSQYDSIVISDYAKGAVTYELIEDVRSKFSGPIFLDTKKTDLAAFHGIFVKINELEYQRRVSINDRLIVTLGGKGAMYKTGRDPKHETRFVAPAVEVVDVTGAGDTFLAAVAYKYLETNNINTAIEFAIRAASITVEHLGVYAPALEEIA